MHRQRGGRVSLATSLEDLKGLSEESVNTLITAAEQRHNLYLVGPPGVGKTMIARRYAQALGGPFRAPHHTVSVAGLRGGKSGTSNVYLGEIGRAHGGTLFLDEAPEFSRQAIDAVLFGYKEGYFTIRHGGQHVSIHYPQGKEGFHLILASNPCPCGYRGSNARECNCSEEAIQMYSDRAKSLIDLCQTPLRL